MGWALSYLPIHVYWAVGGRIGWLGITSPDPDWRAANWGACVVIAGAGLTCLTLVQPCGDILPRTVRHGAAWVGGVFGIAHWAAFSAACVLQLLGVIDYPHDTDQTGAQLRHFDWANLLYFEPWFGVMGTLLIGCSRQAIRRDRVAGPARVPPAPASSGTWRRLATVLTVAGIAVVVWGVFTCDPWVFAGYGPALILIGLLISAMAPGAQSRHPSHPPGREAGRAR